MSEEIKNQEELVQDNFSTDLAEAKDDTITPEEIEEAKNNYDKYLKLFQEKQTKITEDKDVIRNMVRFLTTVPVKYNTAEPMLKLYDLLTEVQKNKTDLVLDNNGITVLHYFMTNYTGKGIADATSLKQIYNIIEPEMQKLNKMMEALSKLEEKHLVLTQGLRPVDPDPDLTIFGE